MNSKQLAHSELREGEILFAYFTENSLAAVGPALQAKLRKGTLPPPPEYRVGRGKLREEYFPCFAMIADLGADTLRRLGYTPSP